MAERKKPARRGPTKAAALKALGLTQEDLDTLKAVAALRNAQSNDDAVDKAEAIAGHPLTRSDAKFDAAEDLLRKDDGQQALEDRQAPVRSDAELPSSTEDPAFYVRNLRGVEVGFRLTRQAESTKKRTQLKPRGARGDMAKLEPGDLRDPELLTQVQYGLVEVIPEGEAQEAIRKQYTNQQTQVPMHIAALRNEYGKEYTTAPRTTTDEESMGYKVADLDPGVIQGKRSDKEIKRDGGFIQPGVVMEEVQTPRPGNIISDGFLAPTQTDMGSDNEKQAAVDAKFRARQFEDRPEDNLGVKVVVEPTQRTQ